MKHCSNPRCNSRLEDDWRFCGECGEHQPAELVVQHEDALRDAAAPIEAYLGHRLVFDREGVEAFDHEKLSLGSLRRRIFRSLAKASLIATVPLVLLTVVSGGDGGGVAAVLWFVITAAVFAYLVNRPEQKSISEWRFVIDGQAQAADRAFAHIEAQLRARQTPTDLMPKIIDGRRYLEIRATPFVAYVSCFAYGKDLYVGWTMWFSSRPTDRLRSQGERKFSQVTGAASDHLLRTTLESDTGKALREVIHNATRAGVAVAIEDARSPQPVNAAPAVAATQAAASASM